MHSLSPSGVSFGRAALGRSRLQSGISMKGDGKAHEGEAADAARRLEAIGTVHKLHAGEMLFVEGETAHKCYEVLSGLIKEFNTLRDGCCHIVDFRISGDIVGLSSTDIYEHTVEAIEETFLISYPAHRFRAVVAETPELSGWLERKILADLARARMNALALSRLSALERVARFLILLARATDSRDSLGGTCAIPMSRQDIADHLGLTIETVCRCLTALKRRGLIEMVSAHGFAITNEPAMAALAGRE